MFKKHIQKKLEKYVKKYFQKHPEVKLVAVAGSVGKTTTKLAIGTILAKKYRVRMESTNHNTTMSVPLAILGISYPENIRSPLAWHRVYRAARKRIKQPADVDVVVQELGIDHMGEMAEFVSYLRPSIGVVTAVAPEHMEFLQNIETVAAEELMLANASELALINRDDINGRFAELLTNQNIDTYGSTGAAEYRFEIGDFSLESGYMGKIIAPEWNEEVSAKVRVLGEHSLRSVTGAIAVAIKLGMSSQEITSSLLELPPTPGRMHVLKGVKHTTLIDDTYNASPSSVEAALQTLYKIDTPQRIALLGDMNELGAVSASEHQIVGQLCDSSLLDWVITVGPESEKYTAPAARAKGCQVKSFMSALDAGAFLHSVINEGAVVLAKGSQNGIFLEEALKIVLHETHEDHELVRQDEVWREQKEKFFQKF